MKRRVLLKRITGAVTAFSFLLLGQELENLREKDTKFGEPNRIRFLTLFT